MNRIAPLVLVAALALFDPATALAQLVPPAGSAGAGNSAISGVLFGLIGAVPAALCSWLAAEREAAFSA